MPVSDDLDQLDQVDQLLGTFFRSEMPDPWPGFHSPLSRAALLTAAPLPGSDSEDSTLPTFAGVVGVAPSPEPERLPVQRCVVIPPVVSPTSLPSSSRARHQDRQVFYSRFALATVVLVMVGGVWSVGGLTLHDQGHSPFFTPEPGRAERKQLPIPESEPEPAPEKHVKSSLFLEQGTDGRTGFRIEVSEEAPPQR
jgi:hypothetical protein